MRRTCTRWALPTSLNFGESTPKTGRIPKKKKNGDRQVRKNILFTCGTESVCVSCLWCTSCCTEFPHATIITLLYNYMLKLEENRTNRPMSPLSSSHTSPQAFLQVFRTVPPQCKRSSPRSMSKHPLADAPPQPPKAAVGRASADGSRHPCRFDHAARRPKQRESKFL